MTTDTRSAHEIERDIERDRAELTDNLDSLQDRFSMDGLIRSVGDQLREHGGDIGSSISRTVKENPAAVTLTGIGLAWMIFGNKSHGAERRTGERLPARTRSYMSHEGGHSDVAVSRPDPRFKGGSEGLPNWARTEEDDEDDAGQSISERVSDAANTARKGASDAASSARAGAARTGAAVSSGAAGATDAVSGAASKVASSAGDMARASQERAARLKKRLAEGTETLSEEAKARVIAAREAAVDARRRAAQAASASAEKASDLYDSQPLVAGALAVAIGAAIGGALPRTQREDDLMGAQRDELMHQAEKIFQEEREKAKAVVAAAKDEATTIAKEKREELDSRAPGDKTAVDAVVDEAKSAGKRVTDAAEQKADEKNLGKIKS